MSKTVQILMVAFVAALVVGFAIAFLTGLDGRAQPVSRRSSSGGFGGAAAAFVFATCPATGGSPAPATRRRGRAERAAATRQGRALRLPPGLRRQAGRHEHRARRNRRRADQEPAVHLPGRRAGRPHGDRLLRRLRRPAEHARRDRHQRRGGRASWRWRSRRRWAWCKAALLARAAKPDIAAVKQRLARIPMTSWTPPRRFDRAELRPRSAP